MGSGGVKPLSVCEKVPEGRWSFVAAVFDHGTTRLYINGRLVSETVDNQAKTLAWTGAPLQVGVGQAPGGRVAYDFDGLLDRVAIWNAALDAEQIKAVYADGRAQYPEQPIALASRMQEVRKNYDPKFARKLDVVAAYEKKRPTLSRPTASPVVKVVEHAGVLAISCDGKVVPAMCMLPQPHATNKGVTDVCRDFAAAGVDFCSEIIWPWLKLGDSCSHWWLGRGKYDFHLEHSPLAPNIVGYQPSGGESSEWFWWGYQGGVLGDYSDTNRAAFRAYLKTVYATDAALAQAWKDDKATLATAQIPSQDLRTRSEDGFFRQVNESRAVADYRRFMSQATTDAIHAVTKTVRANLVSEKLVGVFYGYSMYLAGNPYQRLDNLGFQGLEQVLNDPEVNFLSSPTCYDRRRAICRPKAIRWRRCVRSRASALRSTASCRWVKWSPLRRDSRLWTRTCRYWRRAGRTSSQPGVTCRGARASTV